MRSIKNELAQELAIPESVIERFIAREQQELERCERTFCTDHPFPALRNRTVILIDDGMENGSTMRAAVAAVRQHDPARIIVAVPVASASACQKLAIEADTLVCLYVPQCFYNVGLYYRYYPEVTEAGVQTLLKQTTATPVH
jgi:putative phosphoribosyl transferase